MKHGASCSGVRAIDSPSAHATSSPRGRQPNPRLAGLLVLAFVACSGPKPYVAHVDATAIVRRNSDDAFTTAFDRTADAAAFRAFDAKVVPAHDRGELSAAWNAVPSLHAKGQDFLEQHVFSVAVTERKWPKDAPAESLELAFVQGVHLGVQDFLGGR